MVYTNLLNSTKMKTVLDRHSKVHSNNLMSHHKYMTQLCVGCGICLGVCPSNAVNRRIDNGLVTVEFDYTLCIKCGKCVEACPPLFYLYKGRPRYFETIERIEKIFFGYSTNHDIRFHAASGGVVTSLLLYMLKHKIVDEVLIVRMKGFSVEVLLTDNEDDVISAQGSIYFKTFSLCMLPEIVHCIKKGSKLCIVGLPCQISSVKRVLEDLSDKVYFIALVCSHLKEIWYVEHILAKYLPKNAKVLAMSARRDGWPGTFKVSFIQEDGKFRKLDLRLGQFFGPLPLLNVSAPLGCLLCTDHLASEADIVVGDAWHPKFIGKDSTGVSIIIARTKKGLSLIESAVKYRRVYVQTAKKQDLLLTQRHNIIESLQYAPFRQHLHRHSIEAIYKLKEIDKLAIALLLVIRKLLFKYKTLRRLLDMHPVKEFFYVILWLLSKFEYAKIQSMLLMDKQDAL